MPIVVLESPYSGDIPLNVAYAQRAMFDARCRGETVIIPHLLWTQHHLAPNHFVSDYTDKFLLSANGGRDIAFEQIKALREIADCVVFYVDRGYSSGMLLAKKHCQEKGIYFKERKLGNLGDDEKNARRP